MRLGMRSSRGIRSSGVRRGEGREGLRPGGSRNEGCEANWKELKSTKYP